MEQPRIVVNVGSQRDDYVFGLRPRSRVWFEEQYPEQERVSSVFIGLDRMQSLQRVHESILAQVLHLLTGLPLDELNKIGGFTLYDPATKQEVFNSLRIHI